MCQVILVMERVTVRSDGRKARSATHTNFAEVVMLYEIAKAKFKALKTYKNKSEQEATIRHVAEQRDLVCLT